MEKSVKDFFLCGISFLLTAVAVLFVAAPLSVAQTTPRPAIVRDIDNPDRATIFQEELTVIAFEPVQGIDECIEPPEGRRLVLEHVTARVSTPPGQGIYVGVKTSGLHFGTFIPLISQGTLNSKTYYVGAQSMTLRVPEGEWVCVLLEREPGAGQATAQVWFSGYTIPVP